MSDDSDAFASADESLHTSTTTNTTTTNTNTSSIKESHPAKEESSSTISKAANTSDRDNDSGQIEEATISRTTEHTSSPLVKESNSGELKKKKKVKQKKLKSATPKKREKVKEASLNIDSKSTVKEDILSVSEIVGSEDKKIDSEAVLSPSSEKIDTPAEIVKSETKELINAVNDVIVPQGDEPCEQMFDSNNPNEGVSSLPEEMTPKSADTSGDSKQSTSSMEIHSVIDKLSKVEPIPELDFIASTATNIARGLGDGLSSLVGVLGDVIQLNPSDTSSVNEETLKRRAERQTEEQMERKAISDAWNNVWGTSWTNDDDVDDDENGNQNDGWEVDSPVESEDISKSKLDNNIPEKTNIQEGVNQGVDASHKEPKCHDNVVSQQKSESNNFSWGWSGLSSFSQQLTSSLQATSLNLVQGSVDVLELIGRKTMSVLAENDPGFEYTKKFLRPSNSSDNRPNLSKILREAYELHSSSEYTNNKTSKDSKGDFTYQLEYHRALLHLESLELVSEQANNQLNIRLDSYMSSSSSNQTYNDLLEKIWNYLNLDENDDSDAHHEDGDDSDNGSGSQNSEDNDKSYASVIKKLNQKRPSKDKVKDDICQQLSKHLNKSTIELWCKIIKISYYLNRIYSNERFIKTTTDVWNTCDIDKLGENSIEEIYFQSISSLAQFTSAYLEYLHKFSECILVKVHKTDTDFVELSQILACFFRLSVEAQVCLCQEFIKSMKSIHEKQQSIDTEEVDNEKTKPALSISQYTSNLLLECSNAGSYLKNASNLLVPVVQLACINHAQSSKVE
ncbi:unnamed protein product [Trichobilharzia szidati]|nr:unnamed protein product [Trichobilharzia szidati]